ncbi:hypothetical protein D3C72_1711760 [compost metagenome]
MFGENSLRCGNGLTHLIEMAEFSVAQCVMHQLPFLLRGAARRSYDVQYRHVLRKTAGDSVHRTQFSHTKCREQRGKTFAAGISIGGIGGIEFVGAPHPADYGAVDNVIKELQIVVTRHAKQVLNTTL